MQSHLMIARAALQPSNRRRKDQRSHARKKPIHGETFEEVVRRIRAEYPER